jgi:D-tyrosyl-tRNA(Tyr) deacylase
MGWLPKLSSEPVIFGGEASMKAVIQRVSRARVSVGGDTVSEIGTGLLTLLGVQAGDTEERMQKLLRKICDLRIFGDEQGKMNRSLLDVGGEHLIVSQFTLAGDCSSGKRPSFTTAEKPEAAKAMYERALAYAASLGVPTKAGVFQADMAVELVNDGPVTFILET